jgi:hypothetical protein
VHEELLGLVNVLDCDFIAGADLLADCACLAVESPEVQAIVHSRFSLERHLVPYIEGLEVVAKRDLTLELVVLAELLARLSSCAADPGYHSSSESGALYKDIGLGIGLECPAHQV